MKATLSLFNFRNRRAVISHRPLQVIKLSEALKHDGHPALRVVHPLLDDGFGAIKVTLLDLKCCPLVVALLAFSENSLAGAHGIGFDFVNAGRETGAGAKIFRATLDIFHVPP